jgi:hypothetical protein
MYGNNSSDACCLEFLLKIESLDIQSLSIEITRRFGSSFEMLNTSGKLKFLSLVVEAIENNDKRINNDDLRIAQLMEDVFGKRENTICGLIDRKS